MACSNRLKAEGKPNPRTCQDCGLGPCLHEPFELCGAVLELRQGEVSCDERKGHGARHRCAMTGIEWPVRNKHRDLQTALDSLMQVVGSKKEPGA